MAVDGSPVVDKLELNCQGCGTPVSLREIVELDDSVSDVYLEVVTEECQLDSTGTALRQSGALRCSSCRPSAEKQEIIQSIMDKLGGRDPGPKYP